MGGDYQVFVINRFIEIEPGNMTLSFFGAGMSKFCLFNSHDRADD